MLMYVVFTTVSLMKHKAVLKGMIKHISLIKENPNSKF